MNAEHEPAETGSAAGVSPAVDSARVSETRDRESSAAGTDERSHSGRESNLDRHGRQGPSAEEQRIQDDIPWGVRIAAAWGWRVIVILIVAGVLIWLLSYVSLLLISLMIAALLATLLRPVHDVFLKLRFPRVLASMSSIIVLIGFVAGLLYMVGQQIVSGFAEMADQVEAGVYELIDWADVTMQDFGLEISADEFNNAIDEAIGWVQDNQDAIMSSAAGFGSAASNISVGAVLVIFTLIFFLADGRRIWDFLVNFVPRKHRPAIHGAGRKGWKSLGTYMRVQVFVAFVDAVGIGIGAALLGVPLALPVAVLVFLGGFVPIVGAVVTGAVAVLLALVANGFVNGLLMLGVVLLVQQIESNVLQPIVMGKAVKLHPLAVVLAVTAGTALLSIVGALFAVPILAFINRATQYVAKEEWRNDDVALSMQREQKEAIARQQAAKEQQEAEDEATLATLKRRVKETLPGLDPERPAFARKGAAEELSQQEQADLPGGIAGTEAAAARARRAGGEEGGTGTPGREPAGEDARNSEAEEGKQG